QLRRHPGGAVAGPSGAGPGQRGEPAPGRGDRTGLGAPVLRRTDRRGAADRAAPGPRAAIGTAEADRPRLAHHRCGPPDRLPAGAGGQAGGPMLAPLRRTVGIRPSRRPDRLAATLPVVLDQLAERTAAEPELTTELLVIDNDPD